MQSISTPFHDNQAGIFALVRGNSQRFLSAQIGDRSFTSASINSTDSYNDITAFRVTQSSNGNTKSDYVIVACSNEGNADIFLASNPGQVDSNDLGSMSSCVSIAAKPEDYTNGIAMKAYIAGNSRLGEITFSVNLFDNSGFDVTAFNSSVSVIPEGSAVEIRAVAGIENLFNDIYPHYAIQGSTNQIKRRTSSTTSSEIYKSTSNPLTGSLGKANLTDLILIPDNGLFMVGEDQGLAALYHEQFGGVLSSMTKFSGDGSRCIDALAWDGSQLWCHDGTSEGRLIRFTPPEAPAS
ncbi:hypothetical protein BGP77_16105 [Saccharospirillum sp. MSK14-1]|uniref:hypothetical protein n=1 Tax=Saccharospirillum sp. MSK14-1 TaxID=1897632 RepID=UPI000D3D1126|nr:hypothetical protein [Saccharospirillum sp. MSK14-1]PTY37983.1 hypothetical protein BGP77_16105 [Saccharospirillum sp. MSK14-1]